MNLLMRVTALVVCSVGWGLAWKGKDRGGESEAAADLYSTSQAWI